MLALLSTPPLDDAWRQLSGVLLRTELDLYQPLTPQHRHRHAINRHMDLVLKQSSTVLDDRLCTANNRSIEFFFFFFNASLVTWHTIRSKLANSSVHTSHKLHILLLLLP